MALMQSWWADPEQSAMRQQVKRGLHQVQAAQAGGYGSIAARENPNNYGSVASREMPGLFGATGLYNPEYQQQQKAQQYVQRAQAKAAIGLRARMGAAQSMGLGGNYNMMAGLFGGLGSLDDDDEGDDDGND